jgi:hypothetical protein
MAEFSGGVKWTIFELGVIDFGTEADTFSDIPGGRRKESPSCSMWAGT